MRNKPILDLGEHQNQVPLQYPEPQSQGDSIKYQRIMSVFDYITEDVILALENKAKFTSPLYAGSILSPVDNNHIERTKKEKLT